MEKSDKTTKSSSERKTKTNLKGTWPVLLYSFQSPFEMPSIWLAMNMVVISSIIWPSDPIHTDDVALIFGMCYIIGAFSKLITGILADKYSRIKLMGITSIGSSASFFLYGFLPYGLAIATFYYIIAITILREIFTGTEATIPSYLDDATDEGTRSQVFGVMNISMQLMYIFSSLICAILFKDIWREYFYIIGIIGIIVGITILVKGEEPKRGSKRKELRVLLKFDDLEYNYNLNRETIKSTLFSKTNLIILFEGMLTQIILIVPQILLIGYLQSPPYNFSPVIFAFLGILFGGPGVIIGSMLFSKRIDRNAEKNIKFRIYYIFISLIISYFIWVIVIFIPYRELTLVEGESIIIFLSTPAHIFTGFLYLGGFLLMGIFAICQRPLIQKLNLPEAQGAITSLNNFFEILSIGVGSILAAVLLDVFNNNYQITVVFLMIIGLLGAMIWLFAIKTIDTDVDRISRVLNQRSGEIEKKS